MSKPGIATAPHFPPGETPIGQRTRAQDVKKLEQKKPTPPISHRTRLHDVKEKEEEATSKAVEDFVKPVSSRTRKHVVLVDTGRKRGLEQDKPDEEVSQPKRGRKPPIKEPAPKKAATKRTRNPPSDEESDSGLENSKENVFNKNTKGAIKKSSAKPAEPAARSKSAARGRGKSATRKHADETQNEPAKAAKPAAKKARGKLAVPQDAEDEGEEKRAKSATRGRGKSNTRKAAEETQAESQEKPAAKKARGKSAVREEVQDETQEKPAKSTTRGRGKSRTRKAADETQAEPQEEPAKAAKPAAKKAREKSAVREDSQDEEEAKKPAGKSVSKSKAAPKKSKMTTKKPVEKEESSDDEIEESKTKIVSDGSENESQEQKPPAKTAKSKAAPKKSKMTTKKPVEKKESSHDEIEEPKTKILSDDSEDEGQEQEPPAKTAKSKAAPKKSKMTTKKPVEKEEIEETPRVKKSVKEAAKDLEKSANFSEEDPDDTPFPKTRPKRTAALNHTYVKPDSDSEDEEDVRDLQKVNNKPKSESKRKITIPDSDSEDDSSFKVSNDEESSESEVEADPSEEESEPETEEETPKKGRKGKSEKKGGKSERKPYAWTKKKDEKKENQDKPSQSLPTTWAHLTYEFLKPENIMDANKNRPDDPDYDPKTLYIPQKFLDSTTPSLKQWWEIKRKNFDCMVLFKIGKFYELYHMDAVNIVNELHVSYNKASFARAGFPQIVYGRYAECLTGRGYKLVRCEQTENSEMAAERCENLKNASKVEKLVRREICQKVCKGTRVQTVLDAEITAPSSNYLLTLVEKVNPETKNSCFGVCFVDTTIGEFYLGQFEDDHANSRLLTLISHYPPVYVIFEKNHLSQPVSKILKTYLPEALFEPLLKGNQFWSADKVLEHLQQESYFEKVDDKINWPKGLRPFLLEEDSEVYVNPDEELALNAFGGCVYILKDYLIDHRLLSQSFFKKYVPLDFADEHEAESSLPNNMVLDAMTIKNLDILHGPGSLLHLLDRCITPFGKRLLREWICKPSCRKLAITLRQDAIQELAEKKNTADKIRTKLKSVGDLERLLSKMHAYGNTATVRNHPDGRALMWDIRGLRKRKVKDFEKTYTGFQDLTKIVEMFEDCESELIKDCAQESFPDLGQHLEYFRDSFDHKLALSDGMINPKPGMDEEYDNAIKELEKIDVESKEYLKKQKKHFDEDGVKLHKTDSQNFLLKVPEGAKDKADDDYELESKTKGFRIYSTDETKDLSSRYNEAQELKKCIAADIDRRLFAKFSENYRLWLKAVKNVAVLDVLLSLADYARSEATCIPKIKDDTRAKEEFYIEIKDGRHPCIANENFIPNDTILGKNGKFFMILTGPNMGGKSTLMRQVGLIVIMSQMGCPVPAESCKITLTDRIFTRLGAKDDIVAGQSTFLVELNETASILQHATPYSLVLLDELGRGTSTYDGTAIASAVVQALLRKKCRTLFSTHYHSLIEDYAADPNILLAHMACTTGDQKADSEDDEENVMFLYKLTEGACPKSYGFNAARLAGIPPNVIQNARSIANELERTFKRRHAFKTILQTRDISSDQIEVLLKHL